MQVKDSFEEFGRLAYAGRRRDAGMIIDRIENYENYKKLHPLMEEGVRYALSLRESLPGRYDQGEYFVLLQEGETQPLEEGVYEAHKRYWDIQILIEGKELVKWQEISKLTECIPYEEKKDAVFYTGDGISFQVTEGMFYLVMPKDAHMPCCHGKQKAHYRKLVLKLPAL